MEKLKEYIQKYKSIKNYNSYEDEVIPLLREIQKYLFSKLKQEANNIDYVCTLASVFLGLIWLH